MNIEKFDLTKIKIKKKIIGTPLPMEIILLIW